MEGILWLEETHSTNEDAKRHAKAGVPALFTVAAGSQVSGRGRMGRSFYSPSGLGVYLSRVLRPSASAADAQLLTAAAGVAVCEAVFNACGLEPGLKWPNDVLLQGRKLCGILAESAVSGNGGMEYAVVGVGVNLNHEPGDFPPDLRDAAISLKMASCKTFDVRAFADLLQQSMIFQFQSDRFIREKQQLLTRYRELLCMLGKPVMLSEAGSMREAVALDVDEEANLLVRESHGGVTRVGAGEISLRFSDTGLST